MAARKKAPPFKQLGELDLNHSAAKAFRQHGFLAHSTSGTNQLVGRCPFCGKEHHFYLNIENKAWDCKSCQKSGGFQTFLQEMAIHCKNQFSGKVANKLAEDRGLKLKTLRKFDVGYNPLTKCYMLPILDMKSEKVWDLRIYKSKRFMSTAGCNVGLFGWEQLQHDFKVAWICEGEWDRMAMEEIIEATGSHEEITVGVPGAGTFKSEWGIYFKDKDVNTLYDNDDAGSSGEIKVYNNLKMIVHDLRICNWPDSYGKGFDVRDFYAHENHNGIRAYKGLRGFLRELPKSADTSKLTASSTEDKSLYDGEGLSPEDVYKEYRKWLHLPDTNVIDVMFGTVIANRLPGDPLWLFLVAPPGATKTELLMTLIDAPNITTTTSLTPHSLISGANFAGGGDPSLIPKLNGKCLVVKDFTTILNMNMVARDEIFGILRDAYDGRTEKHFGNGVFRSYESKFAVIAGVTPVIEQFTDEHSALGERFLRYKIHTRTDAKGSKAFLKRALSNVANEDEMRSSLRKVGTQVLKHDFTGGPTFSDEICEKIIALAQWTALMRSTITREKYSGEITHKPYTELGTRLAKQYMKLLLGVGLFKQLDTITDKEYQIAVHMAKSTVSSRMEEVVRKMYKGEKEKAYSTSDIVKLTNLPPMTCGRVMENLMMLHVVQKKDSGPMKTEWVFTEDMKELIETAELY